MNKIFLGICLLFAALTAQATTHIRVFYVFTQAATMNLQQQYGTYGAAATFSTTSVEAQAMTDVYVNSGIDVYFDVAGYADYTTNPGICCGNATNLTQAIAYAESSYQIMSLRDAANADVVVIVGNFSGDGLAGRAGQICATASQAVIAVNDQSLDDEVMAHEMGHILCATHARALNLKSGSTPTDCQVTVSIMDSPVDRLFPNYFWSVSEGNLTYPRGAMISGTGSTPNAANQAMAANCPGANAGGWSYTCTAESCAAPSGTSAYCTHSRTEDSGSFHKNTTGIVGYASYVVDPNSNFSCTNPVTYVPLLEGPNVVWNRAAFGDTNHDNVTAITNTLSTVSQFHFTKLAPGLPH